MLFDNSLNGRQHGCLHLWGFFYASIRQQSGVHPGVSELTSADLAEGDGLILFA